MKLYYYCSSQSCKKINHFTVKSSNRYDLKQEIGEEINERCKHCSSFTKRHINRLHADANYLIIIGGVLLAGLIIILFRDLSFGSTLSTTIPIGIWAYENKKVSEFNKHLI